MKLAEFFKSYFFSVIIGLLLLNIIYFASRVFRKHIFAIRALKRNK